MSNSMKIKWFEKDCLDVQRMRGREILSAQFWNIKHKNIFLTIQLTSGVDREWNSKANYTRFDIILSIKLNSISNDTSFVLN